MRLFDALAPLVRCDRGAVPPQSLRAFGSASRGSLHRILVAVDRADRFVGIGLVQLVVIGVVVIVGVVEFIEVIGVIGVVFVSFNRGRARTIHDGSIWSPARCLVIRVSLPETTGRWRLIDPWRRRGPGAMGSPGWALVTRRARDRWRRVRSSRSLTAIPSGSRRRRLPSGPILERRADREGAREAVGCLVRLRALRRTNLGEAPMTVVGTRGSSLAVVFVGHEGAGRCAVDDGQPAFGHRNDDTRHGTHRGGTQAGGSERPIRASRVTRSGSGIARACRTRSR